jgi:hypothetical protein
MFEVIEIAGSGWIQRIAGIEAGGCRLGRVGFAALLVTAEGGDRFQSVGVGRVVLRTGRIG